MANLDSNYRIGEMSKDQSLGSSYIDVFSHDGKGSIFSFYLSLSNDRVFCSLEVDSTDVFSDILFDDLTKSSAYNMPGGGGEGSFPSFNFPIKPVTSNSFVFNFWPLGVEYRDNFKIKLRKNGGGWRSLKAGMVSYI